MENLEHNERNIPQEELSSVENANIVPELHFDLAQMVEQARPCDGTEDALSFDTVWDDEFFKSLGLDEDLPEEEEPAAEEEDPVQTDAVYTDDPPIPEEPQPEQPDKKKVKDPWQKSLLLYLHDLAYLLAGIIIVFLLLFRVVVVSGSSMKNTLYNGDYLLLVSNVFYRTPEQGDIIVASKDSFKDGAPIVKRVIATEGQTVYIDFENGIVYVDGEPIEEPYIIGSTTMDEGMHFPLTVEEGCVFVLGDNRGDSKDSRDPEIGLIDEREIMGKVFFLFLPGSDYSGQRDFGRIGVVS